MSAVSFNQDCSALVLSSKSGYQLYNLNHCHVGEIVRTHKNVEEKNIHIIARLFNSSLLVTVHKDTPCTIRVSNLKKGAEICKHSFAGVILSLKLSRERLVVCMASHYVIYNTRDMKIVHTLKDTVSNPTGLFALSVCAHTSLIAYPASENSGCIAVFDAMDMQPVSEFPAHSSTLAAITFNYNADIVATASCKGTVIRTFSVATGEKLVEFRRGLKRCVAISSLAFSQDGMFLVASSNTETVHVFKVQAKSSEESEETAIGWTEYFTSAITSSATALIPFSGAFNAWRAYATARLEKGDRQTTTGIITLKNVPYIIVVDSEANLSIFKLDVENGGECELVKTQCLEIEEADEENNLNVGGKTTSVSSDTALSCDKTITDASYAYKLKREKKCGPITTSQELSEIIDNVPMFEEGKLQQDAPEKLKLDDSSEFPAMSS